jgi:hypothetical protein
MRRESPFPVYDILAVSDEGLDDKRVTLISKLGLNGHFKLRFTLSWWLRWC